ncbi:S-adenosyl-L-methionine-dependent methyltransferase [Trametes punicea]|nr:S-adenosyl-L-methionine-dependent methyltransferase [Trametes punicea]
MLLPDLASANSRRAGTSDLSIMSNQTGHSLYVIPANSPEIERLGKQYALKRALFGWNSPVPPSVDVSRLSNVLDVGAGTCAWILDFANMPEVKSRLALPGKESPSASTPVHLYACDIETQVFPDKALTDEFGVTTFQQDVTKPFPPEMHQKFDLVHLSFLFLCLTKDGWTKALRNINQVLKPGGMLIVAELDPIMYHNVESIPPEDAPGHDLNPQLTRSDWVGKANRIYTAFSLENDFLTEITYRLPDMLRAAGYMVRDWKRFVPPAGKVCAQRPGLEEFEDFTVENFKFVWQHLAMALLAKDKLRTPDEEPVTTEKQLQSILDEVERGLRGEGAVTFGKWWLAVKESG